MKKYGLILLLILGISCTTTKKTGLLPEDQILVTRQYVGNFIDYRHTEPEKFGDPHIIWIKTTMDSTYGKISAYSKKCEFSVGDKIYLKRTFITPGVFGHWEYQIENGNNVWYRISEFQYGNKILAQSWF